MMWVIDGKYMSGTLAGVDELDTTNPEDMGKRRIYRRPSTTRKNYSHRIIQTFTTSQLLLSGSQSLDADFPRQQSNDISSRNQELMGVQILTRQEKFSGDKTLNMESVYGGFRRILLSNFPWHPWVHVTYYAL